MATFKVHPPPTFNPTTNNFTHFLEWCQELNVYVTVMDFFADKCPHLPRNALICLTWRVLSLCNSPLSTLQLTVLQQFQQFLMQLKLHSSLSSSISTITVSSFHAIRGLIFWQPNSHRSFDGYIHWLIIPNK